jgi:hypothetical protein
MLVAAAGDPGLRQVSPGRIAVSRHRGSVRRPDPGFERTPRAVLPGRAMADVLRVPAREIGDPFPVMVLVKSGDDRRARWPRALACRPLSHRSEYLSAGTLLLGR